MNRDTVIGIVGVLILVAAMFGVFKYERDRAADALGGGDLATTTLAGPEASGTSPLGQSADATVALNQTGMVNVTFTLRWTPSAGVDTLRFSVAPSQATGMTEGAQSEAEDDGEITLTIPVNNTGANGALGVGDWQVSVEFVSASTGLPAEPPIAPPGSTDTQVSWTVTTQVEAYDTAAA